LRGIWNDARLDYMPVSIRIGLIGSETEPAPFQSAMALKLHFPRRGALAQLSPEA